FSNTYLLFYVDLIYHSRQKKRGSLLLRDLLDSLPYDPDYVQEYDFFSLPLKRQDDLQKPNGNHRKTALIQLHLINHRLTLLPDQIGQSLNHLLLVGDSL